MVAILMATYNGGKYIENQILSLLSQTLKEWVLYIHDDGSVDDTLAIVKKYQQIDQRINLIEDGITFGDAPQNFMHLLKFSNSDFTIFCDQDDIWFESKLENLYNFLKIKEEEVCAVFCNGYAYSKSDGIIGNSITDVFPQNLREQLFLNAGIQGCSLMFTKATREKLKTVPNFVAMHDHFVTLGVITFGRLYCLNKKLMLYRQLHENKATSNIQFDKWQRFKSIFSSEIPVVDRRHCEATTSFFYSYEKQMDTDVRKLFLNYMRFGESSSKFEQLAIIYKNKFSLYGSVSALLLKVLLRRAIN